MRGDARLAREAKPAQSRLHFRNAHEQLPQQPGTMILHHDDNGPLIDGDVGVSVPVPLLAESIGKSVTPPELLAMLVKKVTQSAHHFARRVGQTRKSGRR